MYISEWHYCSVCRIDLGSDNGDGICSECEAKICEDCLELRESEESECKYCKKYLEYKD